MTIAAIGDIHVGLRGGPSYHQIFKEISEKADVLVLTGDLTNSGSPDEASELHEQLSSCLIPVLTVLGNHDYDQDKQDEIRKAIESTSVSVLNGTTQIIESVGFVGAKGFGGGFGSRLLVPFGEPAIKAFVQEAVDESLRIEKELSVLETPKKVIILHYSPIQETLEGEPLDIYPFLGCTRMARSIDQYGADVIFHGHSHHGTAEGKTQGGIPVFNVAYPLMQKINPSEPYKLYTLD